MLFQPEQLPKIDPNDVPELILLAVGQPSFGRFVPIKIFFGKLAYLRPKGPLPVPVRSPEDANARRSGVNPAENTVNPSGCIPTGALG